MKRITVCVLMCFCLILAGCGAENTAPDPQPLQVVNPLKEVDSLEQMEQLLDFSLPVLDKEVDQYIVLVIDGYPQVGRIYYSDGSLFSMKYGSGDISGIYGGTVEKTDVIDDCTVTYCSYGDDRYAIWEKDGFSFSLTEGTDLESEVSKLLKA